VFFCLTFFPVYFFVFGLLFFCVYVHHGMIFGKNFIFYVLCVKIVFLCFSVFVHHGMLLGQKFT